MGNSINYNRNIKDNNIELKKNIGKIKIILRNIENNNNNKILKKKTKKRNNNIRHEDYRDNIEDKDINENRYSDDEIVSNIPLNVWQEFYDDSAEAKYWYNAVTGEATWVKPGNEIQSSLILSSPKNINNNKCIKKIKKKLNYNKTDNEILKIKNKNKYDVCPESNELNIYGILFRNKNMKVHIEPTPIYSSV